VKSAILAGCIPVIVQVGVGAAAVHVVRAELARTRCPATQDGIKVEWEDELPVSEWTVRVPMMYLVRGAPSDGLASDESERAPKCYCHCSLQHKLLDLLEMIAKYGRLHMLQKRLRLADSALWLTCYACTSFIV
jgi:hypothetical protein